MESLYKTFIETGRVVRVTYGPSINKIAVIVDIVNMKRVIIDGPTTGVPRQVITVRRIELLPQLVNTPRKITSEDLKKALENAENKKSITEAQQERSVKLRVGKENLKNMTDFERFKYERAVTKLKAERRKIAGL